MSWRVELGRDAKKEFARLPSSVQKRVTRALLSLETDPFPTGCKKLKNRAMGGACASAIIESFTSQTKLRDRLSSASLRIDEMCIEGSDALRP